MSTSQLTLAALAILMVLGASPFAVSSCSRYQRLQNAENEMEALAMDGEGQLKKAKFDRQIAVEEAEAKKAAAKFLGEAEEIRAMYLAKAMDIISMKLKANPEYISYLWVQGLADDSSKVIYVPTEANLPILEAGKRK